MHGNCSYLTHENPPTTNVVKTLLDEHEVSVEWHDLRIRIMQVEPDDNEASGILSTELAKFEPAGSCTFGSFAGYGSSPEECTDVLSG